MYYNQDFYEFPPANQRSSTRFRNEAFPFDELEILEHAMVVDITFKHQYIYVIAKSAQRVIRSPSVPSGTSLQELYSELSPELQRTIGVVQWPDFPSIVNIVQAIQDDKVIGVSDGSVRITEHKATHAWIIQAEDGSEICGGGPVDGKIEARTIHRAELQGQTAILLMLSLLAKCTGIIGGAVNTYCDNKAVVQKLKKGWHTWRYRHTKGADSDLQAQVRQTLVDLNNMEFTTNPDWVKGHQDTAGAVVPLPRQVDLNIRMDEATKEAYLLPPQWQTRAYLPILKAEGCAIYIGNQKVTSNLHLCLREQWHEAEAKNYLLQRHNISTDSLQIIHWDSLHFALKRLRYHRRALAIKVIHRHTPTYEKLFKQGRVVMSSLCPCCVKAVETNSHVYCCTNESSVIQQKKDWSKAWEFLRKQRTSPIIEHSWRMHLQILVGLPTGESITDTVAPAVHGELAALLTLAIQEQTTIGWDKLLVGMGAQSWKTLQGYIDANNPRPPQRTASAWMNSAMSSFLKFSISCWKQRNKLVHGATKQEQHRFALQKARDKVKQLYDNPPALAHQFSAIQAVPLAHRLKLSLQSTEHWLSTIAHQVKVTAHNIQMLLRQHRSITSHFRTMRRIARNQAKERALPETPRKDRWRAVQARTAALCADSYKARSKKTSSTSMKHKLRGTRKAIAKRGKPGVGNTLSPYMKVRPSLRHHPP